MAAQGPVVLPEAADGGAVGLRDGGQGLSPPDGVDLPGEADHQRLPHRQGTAGGHGVVRRQAGGTDAVGFRDGADGLAGLDDMNGHQDITSLGDYAKGDKDMSPDARGSAGRRGDGIRQYLGILPKVDLQICVLFSAYPTGQIRRSG